MADAPDHGPAVDPDGGSVRLRLDLGYDGTDFRGWAVQPGLRTVAGVVGDALATVLRTDPDRVMRTLAVAGRTDAGVHAAAQVAHLDVGRDVLQRAGGVVGVTRRLRGMLAPDVRVAAVTEAPPGFEARYSALRRHYRYRVCDHPAGPYPLRRRDTLAHPLPLDPAGMTAASERLLGLQDFAAFCRRRDGATTIRTLLAFDWVREDDGTVVASISADAFCHSMVRALVGAVLPVGDGRRATGWPREVLRAGVRDPRVTVAAAHGLTLVGVDYPDAAGLAVRAAEARARRDGRPVSRRT
ncbi:tRNA pseudouridine synthase A [Jannaschia sp. R86511]|uniref:tRNA pseudouridine synthase A n=1 Tax=Jannaschia sp. R86511 TaxID=3093853 RepID=UPI0036D26AD0